MLKSIEGTYRDGRVNLSETPEDLEEARVIVTFLSDTPAGMKTPKLLSDYGIDEAQAADLRGRLRSFEEDWNLPDMEAYDAL